MAGYNQEFRSRIIVDGFAFSFGQKESVERSLTFRVSAYSRDRPICEIFQTAFECLHYTLDLQ